MHDGWSSGFCSELTGLCHWNAVCHVGAGWISTNDFRHAMQYGGIYGSMSVQGAKEKTNGAVFVRGGRWVGVLNYGPQVIANNAETCWGDRAVTLLENGQPSLACLRTVVIE